ncbi:hypothetical protein ACTMTF_15385 [Nonomuraea sp. ZG12]|uniref:hypothetical protein n=1 Tax=Nonomuraea sp. ZG12 TaxID=3452207 RepID=UPI003F886D92
MSAYDNDPWATDEPANVPDYVNQPPDDAPTEDPWAAEAVYADPPRDEAQNNIPATPAKKETYVTNVNNSEAKITTTIKYGSGFDAPWTVFHSDSVEDAKSVLNEAKDLIELTAKVAKYAKTLDSGTAPAGQRGGGNSSGQQRSQQNSTPPGVETKNCAHGDMKYITGNGAKGPWAGHFCPLEKGNPDQCKPVFVKMK